MVSTLQTGSGLLNIYTTGASSTTAVNTFWTTATNACGQSNGYSQQQQMALNQQQAAQQYGQLQQLGMQQQTPPLPPTPEQAEVVLTSRGYVVLKKMQRVAHHFPRGPLMRPLDPVEVTARVIDGYAIPRQAGEYLMPDGSVLIVDPYGNYRVEDHEAKVTYQACRVREFNRYINASDLLEQFVAAIGKHPLVDQSNVLKLPVEAFVNWLIVEAAKKDGDKLDGLPTVEEALLALPAPRAVAA